MKIKLTSEILNYDNKPILDEEKKPITYRSIFITALNAQIKSEELKPEQKFKMFSLSVKIYEADEVDLNVEDLVLIKERVGLIFTPIIYGRVNELLEKQV